MDKLTGRELPAQALAAEEEWDKDETLGSIVANDWRKAAVLKKYEIDFCCGGKRTVQQVCEEKGLDADQIYLELQNKTKKSDSGIALHYNDWSPDFLVDYIVCTHHSFVRQILPEIKIYASKILRHHGQRHPGLHKIHDLIELLATEMLAHMEHEEEVLFPRIKVLVAAKNAGIFRPGSNFPGMEGTVNTMEKEHETVGRMLAEIRVQSHNYSVPVEGCSSYKMLYNLLQEFEKDLHLHVHLENNILFPKAINIEKLLN